MTCTSCGHSVPEGSAFCNRCGARLALGVLPEAPAAVARPPESELWRGRYSGRSMALSFIGLFALGLAIVITLLVAPGVGSIAATVLGVAWAVLAFVLVARLLYRKWSLRYRLTTERLFLERGILRRDLSELELLRVDDVAFSQNLVQRFFDVGTITVHSTDSDHPKLVIEGVAVPEAVKEKIRNQMRGLRRGALHVEQL
jgi:uncharacterized membrane protein YdbT with pleckstrin-like domain